MILLSILLAAGLVSRPYITAADFHSGRYDNRQVHINATIVDAFNDESDPAYVFFVLRNSGDFIYAYIKREFLDCPPEDLVGAEIAPWGVVIPPKRTQINPRRQAQRFYDIPNHEAFVVTRQAPNPYGLPDIDTAADCRPAELALLGRRTAQGTVLAVWNVGKSILIACSNRIVRADLASADPPSVGEHIVAAGRPETDLMQLNLSRAVWRPEPRLPALRPSEATPVSLKDLLTNKNGRRAINRRFRGRLITLTVPVRSAPDNDLSGRFTCGDGTFTVTVDISAGTGERPDLTPGDTVRVTGVAICDVDNCRPSAAFPQVRGYIVVPVSSAGIAVVARAQHPLPKSAWYVFGALLAVLCGIVLWNRSLQRLALKRGRDLAQAEIAHAEADLRTVERTRLAVELHDSISQVLTGVALEIETSQRLAAGPNPNSGPSLSLHLDRARQTLASCRNELRNCLWDLRSDALEESDMNEAVRRTLLPNVKDVDIAVRFNVPRDRLSDNTAHALLRIIRELTVNAVRHGGATHVQVAGTVDGDRLLVSVRDNGRGFNPAAAPGVSEGHFGLEGIRERIGRMSGTFEIESAPGKGTRAVVALAIPAEQELNA